MKIFPDLCIYWIFGGFFIAISGYPDVYTMVLVGLVLLASWKNEEERVEEWQKIRF